MSKHKNYKTQRMNLELIASLAIIMVTTLGSTIPLYLHTSSQMQSFHKEIREDIHAIYEEMKDFHGRLCAIEERNKK